MLNNVSRNKITVDLNKKDSRIAQLKYWILDTSMEEVIWYVS